MAMSLSSTSGGSCSRVSTASATDSTARTLAPDCSSTAATDSRAPASSSTRSTRTPRRLGLGWNSPPLSAGCVASPRAASDPGSGTHGVERRLAEGREIDRPGIEDELPGRDARHVQELLDQLRLRDRAPLDRLDRARSPLGVELTAAQQARPHANRAERRAQ